jgi:hypothetical protein
MKSTLLAGALFVAVALALAPFVRSENVPNRPPGVGANAWIPLNDRLGFVVTPETKFSVNASRNALLLAPPVSGYFMIRGASRWFRVVLVDGSRSCDAG